MRMVLKKMILSSAGPPRVNRVSSKSKEKRYRSCSGFGSARTGRKRINSISIRHLPSLRRGSPHTRRVQPEGCHPLPALPKDAFPHRLCRRNRFRNGFRLRNYFLTRHRIFPGVPGRGRRWTHCGGAFLSAEEAGIPGAGTHAGPAPGGRQGCSYPPHT